MLDYASPPGDPGLFGPQTMYWTVHAGFMSMMIGGISALLLQALHPLALAGVLDHSSYTAGTRSQKVTGPSLTNDTCIAAPNSPVWTIGCCCRARATK